MTYYFIHSFIHSRICKVPLQEVYLVPLKSVLCNFLGCRHISSKSPFQVEGLSPAGNGQCGMLPCCGSSTWNQKLASSRSKIVFV